MLVRVICLVIGYLFGMFESGYFYAKLHGTDIRKQGSGNSGSTNVLRVMGKKAGAIVLFFDVMKAILACLVVRLLFSGNEVPILLLVLYTGLGVVLGHNYPFYLNFKGGKGIAATGGCVLAIGDWRLTILCLSIFLIVVLVSRYVSLGSLVGVAALFLSWVSFTQLGMIDLLPQYYFESYVVMFLFTALAFVRHRTNIQRLIAGNENKIFSKKEK